MKHQLQVSLLSVLLGLWRYDVQCNTNVPLIELSDVGGCFALTSPLLNDSNGNVYVGCQIYKKSNLMQIKQISMNEGDTPRVSSARIFGDPQSFSSLSCLDYLPDGETLIAGGSTQGQFGLAYSPPGQSQTTSGNNYKTERQGGTGDGPNLFTYMKDTDMSVQWLPDSPMGKSWIQMSYCVVDRSLNGSATIFSVGAHLAVYNSQQKISNGTSSYNGYISSQSILYKPSVSFTDPTNSSYYLDLTLVDDKDLVCTVGVYNYSGSVVKCFNKRTLHVEMTKVFLVDDSDSDSNSVAKSTIAKGIVLNTLQYDKNAQVIYVMGSINGKSSELNVTVPDGYYRAVMFSMTLNGIVQWSSTFNDQSQSSSSNNLSLLKPFKAPRTSYSSVYASFYKQSTGMLYVTGIYIENMQNSAYQYDSDIFYSVIDARNRTVLATYYYGLEDYDSPTDITVTGDDIVIISGQSGVSGFILLAKDGVKLTVALDNDQDSDLTRRLRQLVAAMTVIFQNLGILLLILGSSYAFFRYKQRHSGFNRFLRERNVQRGANNNIPLSPTSSGQGGHVVIINLSGDISSQAQPSVTEDLPKYERNDPNDPNPPPAYG
ncbi:hypothetical protein MIR68_001620 [Amoeboaphelidium protococcarum]|nr:hypothetical protein MIR68_001620 [Amoeboaphelidium protococcarum]